MKRFYLTLALLAVCVQLFAQIDPTVEVSRRFDVSLQDIHKPVLPTSVADSLHRFDVSFDYSIFNPQYTDLYEFTPYEAAQLATVNTGRKPVFYARVGTQYPLMPNAEVFLQGGKKGGIYGSLYGRHDSFWGKLLPAYGDEKFDSDRMENTVGGNLCYAWATGEFKVDVNYNFDKFNYKPNLGHELGHSNNYLNIGINFNSAHSEDNSVYYDVTVAYRNTDKDYIMTPTVGQGPEAVPFKANIGENYIGFSGIVGATFDIHRIYIDMDVEYASYSETHDFSSGVVELSPIYRLQRKWFDAKLGIKFGSRYMIKGKEIDTDVEADASTSFFPNVDMRLALVKDNLWFHALVGGGNDLNPFAKMLQDCPVLMPYSDIVCGKRPIDMKFSLESLLLGRLSLNVFGGYVVNKNKLIYVPAYGVGMSSILAGYRDVNTVSAGAELFFRTQDFTLDGDFRYNICKDVDKNVVTELPKMEGNVSARYSFRERIIAQFDCRFKGAVSGSFVNSEALYEVPAIVDMGFNLNYILNRHFSIYGKIGNILDKRNQYMPLYVEPGRNFGGGICVSF